jgi:hypothetical protein
VDTTFGIKSDAHFLKRRIVLLNGPSIALA